MNRKLSLIPLFFFILLNLFSPVYATSDVNMSAIPSYLADKLSIPTFAGQILATTIILMITLLPIALIRHRRGFVVELVVGTVVLGFSIAIGWLPYWFLLVVCLLIAGMFAGNMRKWVTGG